jgi:hypothetical protein
MSHLVTSDERTLDIVSLGHFVDVLGALPRR